ncbi:NVEALA domain-containing protein [Parabacteroides sp. OttesenSCG-928-G07]|nr:NVEALA domain-containing protein [Parabacteroides sp. OttesenSCG-928-G07]
MKQVLKLFIVVIGVASLLILSKKENQKLKELTFQNIEALAEDEGSDNWCLGDGSLDCNGIKVKYIYSKLR